ncbi:MAG TPA: galactokinase [Acidimicrobiales bacterium]|jgi:D-glycero-alpha-D-manno-heptose-7-phosphate kinase
MIITRTPLRISIGGGGTDLPSYYERRGGFLISAAINRYIYIAINDTFTGDYVIKYSALERAERVDDISHPLVREALRLHPIGEAKEIVSIADIPAGTGLGSSGAFTVGLLRALHAYKREHVTAGALAEEACHIEIDILHEPVGKQDQYIAAYGGLSCFEIDPDGKVRVSPVAISTDTLRDLEEHLLLFFTGYSRRAGEVLSDQHKRSQEGDEAMLSRLAETEAIGRRIGAALEEGDTTAYGNLMHEHWLAKRDRSPHMSNSDIDRWYQAGIDNGAVGGKLVGAGAGGFLMFYAKDAARLRETMSAEGLNEVRFFFDHDGSTVMTRD